MNDIIVEGRGTRDERQKCAPHSTFDARRSTARSGVALVITVILLAVVLLMALTFLAISRRERSAVTTTTDTATAKLAADDALAAAEAQIMANTLATTNPYNFGLLVSTNFINPYGFNPAVTVYSPTNVNYDYQVNGQPLTADDFLQNLANLYYLPRAPVYATNYLYQTNELQFYLDLNRNGRDEPNGWWPELGNNGLPIVNGGVTNYMDFVGDPEWIGVLQHPDQPYGPNNPFVARYAFVAVPIGNALDLNHIYNQTLDVGPAMGQGKSIIVNGIGQPLGVGNDAFRRNQGVGPWEINLAAFLADLSTNEWGQIVGSPIWYQYNEANPTPSPNQGHAFDDARALLAYRYQNNYLTLKPASLLFYNQPVFPNGIFPNDNIDEYSDGPLQNGTAPIDEAGAPLTLKDNPFVAWAGAPNTNHFFSMQDLFDPTKANIGAASALNSFTNRLLSANYGLSTYDRYTYYRLLAQMGVDSTPVQDQINLNYSNAIAYYARDPNGNIITGDVTNIVFYPNAQTNLTPWTPLQFFTIAADRMLRTYSQEWITENPSNYVATYCMTTNISTAANPVAFPTNVPVSFGVSDIPVVISNRFVYTPAIQRVLQLAANIYDATTNTATVYAPDYPSVFRPIFNLVPVLSRTGEIIYTNVYIAGYEPVEYDGVIGAVNPVLFNAGTDPDFYLPVNVADLLNPNYQIPYYGYSGPFGSGTYTNVNVYGVPWIIGAKKGFPNFNEFAMEGAFLLTRKLEVTRPSTSSPISDYQYNQMFNLSLNNQLGVECWNSYSNYYQYPAGQRRSVAIYVNDSLSVTLTNDEIPFIYTTNFLISSSLQIPNPTNANWPGYSSLTIPSPSFQIPLNTNIAVIPTSEYRFNMGGTPYLATNLYLPFETGVEINGNRYPQPHWWLMTTNNLRVFILDTTDPNAPQIIDYVQLAGPNSTRDLTSEIISNFDTTPFPSEPGQSNFWSTNILNGLPVGLDSQIQALLGDYTNLTQNPPPTVFWPGSLTDHQNEIDGFRAFFGLGLIYNNPSGEQMVAEDRMTNAIHVSLSPIATMVQKFDWQANDPLVHCMTNDLQGASGNGVPFLRLPNQPSDWPLNLGIKNTRYWPWSLPTATNAMSAYRYDLALKDPLVWRSDDWDFPTYKLATVGWLGRVHRGTPWQTVYLKSPDILREIQVTGGNQTNYIGLSTWAQWTGDSLAVTNQNSITYFDAENSAPVQDWLLFDLFTTAPDDNATRGQLSVNVDASNPSPQAGLAAWSALFSGVQVLSNSAPDTAVNPAIPTAVQHNGFMGNYIAFPIDPAGPEGASSALGQIVTGINDTRTNFVNADGLPGTFEHVGDILAVPQLTYDSPFLNTNVVQRENGISDEMYEWLPEQVMSLLRVSGTPQSPMRYVIYSYGQALKPAPGGIYTGGGPFFGMVTNYQVVAESASRAVVNFGSVKTNVFSGYDFDTGTLYLLPHGVPVVTNNTAQIEQFNVLPPD